MRAVLRVARRPIFGARSNQKHRSTADPDAKLYRKGPGMKAKQCFTGLGWWRTAPARSSMLGSLVSRAKPSPAALDIIERFANCPRAIALGADKGYDAADFAEESLTINVRPHVARNTSGRRSAIDRRTMRHSGHAKSQHVRKRIEAFGWIKTVAHLRKTDLRGLPKIDWSSTFAAAAYNLVRAPKLIAAAT
jgi:hypothetical protein